MTTTPTTQTFTMDDKLPTLHLGWPTCSHCGTDVEVEDGIASCATCLVSWSDIADGEQSTPDLNADDADVLCRFPAEHPGEHSYDRDGKRWDIGPRQPCILPTGHTGSHLHPYGVTVTPLAEVTR